MRRALARACPSAALCHRTVPWAWAAVCRAGRGVRESFSGLGGIGSILTMRTLGVAPHLGHNICAHLHQLDCPTGLCYNHAGY